MFSIQQQLTILTQIDSTNNYAMGQIRAGLANHGQAWMALEQTSGKGQRGRQWIAEKGANILLSIALQPDQLGHPAPFVFNAAVALACCEFFEIFAGDETSIKWPNDIYWRDRKAGGILIENIYAGENGWVWAVAGMGININQKSFAPELKNPVSLRQITGKDHNVSTLTLQLCDCIEKRLSGMIDRPILEEYNNRLFKKGLQVRLKKENRIFEAVIHGVNPLGELIAESATVETFRSGEIEWIL